MRARMKNAGRSFRTIRASSSRFLLGRECRRFGSRHRVRSGPDAQSAIMTIVEVEPRRGGSLALREVQIGAIAVVVAVTTFHAFELDRFFVPKELVLHAAAALAGLLALRALWRTNLTRVDLLLAGYLGLSALSALMATNRWLAFRA